MLKKIEFNIFKKRNIIENIWFDLKNVDIEIKRQIINHEITFIACDNQLTISPVSKANNILNLGSGYGIWAYEYFKEYGGGTITNIDIKKMDICDILKEYNYILPNRINIYFKRLDLKKTYLDIEYDTIDFVYQRDMLSIYNKNEWSNLIKEIYKVLKIGGYIEFVEFNFVIKHEKYVDDNNTYSNIINNFLINIFKENDYIYDVNYLIKIIEDYIKVDNVKIVKLPLYGDTCFNEICIENIILGYAHIKNMFEKKYNKFEDFIEKLKIEWINNKSYIELYIFYIQK